MRRTHFLTGLLALLLLMVFSGAPALAAEKIPTMTAAQLISLINREKGKVIVVNVFASWCPPCRDEVPSLVKLRGQYAKDKVFFTGVSVDREIKALNNFLDQVKVNYPIYLATGDFAGQVGVTAVPQLLVYNKKGELVFNNRGLVEEGDLKKALDDLLSE